LSDPILCEAAGSIDGVNTDFTTFSPYYPGSLWAYLDGQLIRKSDDDGPIELGGNSVRMKRAPLTNSRVHFYYQERGSTAVAFPVAPELYMALVLEPVAGSAVNLLPRAVIGENLDVAGSTPEPVRAINLIPMPAHALDLVPRPLSAEEV